MKKFYIEMKSVITNPKITVPLILIMIATYGFAITNFSMGIDDPAAYIYSNSSALGSMLQQGRLLHLFNIYLTKTFEFMPFFNDFLGYLVFFFSLLAGIVFIKKITNDAFRPFEYVIFASIIATFPIFNEKLVFQLDLIPIMVSYFTLFLSMYLLYDICFDKEDSLKTKIIVIITIILTISSYEIFNLLWISLVFGNFILIRYCGKMKLTFKDIIRKGIKYAIYFITSFIVYYLFVKLMQYIFADGINYDRRVIEFNLKSIFDSFKEIIKTIIKMENFSFTMTIIGLVLTIVLTIYYAIKEKNGIFVFLNFFMWLICFTIFIFQGFVLYRAYFIISAPIAVVVMICLFVSRNYLYKSIVVTFVCVMIFIQAKELNIYFYNDYKRYEKELYAIHAIATELIRYHDIEKPVVFLIEKNGGIFDNYHYQGMQMTGNSMLNWAVAPFDKDRTVMSEIFRKHGYTFIKVPNDEQVEQAKKVEMPFYYPQDGFIRETDNLIIIRFGL